MPTPRIMTVFGTRPEAIKVAPVIQKLQSSSAFESVAVSTGQHREMLDQVTTLFDISPDLDLNIIQPRQSLTDIGARTMTGVAAAISQYSPDAVIVQGDTTTSTFAALAAFYNDVPVVHLEAGLRTGNLRSPFPEEANRKLTTQISSLHLAPTSESKQNLLDEGVNPRTVHITGNTVIDALKAVSELRTPFSDPRLEQLREISSEGKRIVLVTAHRRENLAGVMEGIGVALAKIARARDDVHLVFPIHKNPAVRDAVLPQVDGIDSLTITEPLGYGEFTRLMAMSDIVLTDSGGVQEEAPSLGKPVLVMRDTTERPEAVKAGTVRLVGTVPDKIVAEVSRLLDDPTEYERMSRSVNPYGDGLAADRTLAALENFFDLGSAAPDFLPHQ